MSALQELTISQINQTLKAAAERHVPVTVTIRQGGSWANLRSRLLAVRNGRLLLEQPAAENGAPPREFAPADRLSASFKLKHHKHVFCATVAGVAPLALDDGSTMPALSVVAPTRMQRLQRRSFTRAAVPPGRIVRASFWLGGRGAEPAGATPDRPVWSGSVTDLSAGGFMVRTTAESAKDVEPGDTVGVHIAFGAGDGRVFADATLRHADIQDNAALMGFQFIGLTETPEGREALQIIGRKVSEFQHAAEAVGHRYADD
jgi:c-di-GMP-binding flagellar brake protein YcgR